MNEQLQMALAEIITASLTTAEAAKAFVLAELPDVVRQVLVWKATMSAILCAVWAAAAAVFLRVGARRYRNMYEAFDAREQRRWWPPSLFSSIAIVPIVFAILSHSWLKILLAPKLYLLEYAARLVGK